MTSTTTTAKNEVRRTLSARPGASRKLLERMAAAHAGTSGDATEALEDSFPGASEAVAEQPAPAVPAATTDDAEAPAVARDPADDIVPAGAPDGIASEPTIAPNVLAADAPAAIPATAPASPAWTAQDEALFRGLSARRKAAGFQTRGRDVSTQSLVAGEIKPNPGTVVAVILGLVAERGGRASRAELLDAMANAAFPNAKARPQDRDWCHGYVAGAVRAGFLAVAGQDAGQEPVAAAADQPSAEAA